MELSKKYIEDLQTELLRVTGQTGIYHQFTLPNGELIQGATESDTIKHLTSGRDYVTGRQFRFPGMGNGWNYPVAFREAGFRILSARNYRNQPCRIVTI